MPEITDEVKVETARRYMQAFEKITGQTFEAEVGDVLARVTENLKGY